MQTNTQASGKKKNENAVIEWWTGIAYLKLMNQYGYILDLDCFAIFIHGQKKGFA